MAEVSLLIWLTAVLEKKPWGETSELWLSPQMGTVGHEQHFFFGAKQENIMTCFFGCQFLIETTGYMTTTWSLDHWNFNVRSLWSKPFSSFFKLRLHQNHIKIINCQRWMIGIPEKNTNICGILDKLDPRPQKEIPVLWWCAIPKRPQQQGKVWCVFRRL